MRKCFILAALVGLSLLSVTSVTQAQAPGAGRPRGGDSFGSSFRRGLGFSLGQQVGLGFGGFGALRAPLGLGLYNRAAFVQPIQSYNLVQPMQAFTAVQSVIQQQLISQPVIQQQLLGDTQCLTGGCGVQAVVGAPLTYGLGVQRLRVPIQRQVIRQRVHH